ncbi:hypothetical protein Bbelb_219490 [Branchiostoma belcheri]|nr:hypothetical protein Bbelb_219490 [Branchiostoma belcheri]
MVSVDAFEKIALATERLMGDLKKRTDGFEGTKAQAQLCGHNLGLTGAITLMIAIGYAVVIIYGCEALATVNESNLIDDLLKVCWKRAVLMLMDPVTTLESSMSELISRIHGEAVQTIFSANASELQQSGKLIGFAGRESS